MKMIGWRREPSPTSCADASVLYLRQVSNSSQQAPSFNNEMSNTAGRPAAVVPAQLSFLAIYNPSLGNTDETFRDQIVFYSSKAARARRKRTSSDNDSKQKEHEEDNEKLRQIGLAQGMVEFARHASSSNTVGRIEYELPSFSNGEAVDSVETEKSRIILHELEPGWWILASIDLTRLPSNSLSKVHETSSGSGDVEYSAREVSPPALLLRHLLRAHSIFLLHHAPSLAELFSRSDRAKFCTILDRFWTRFIFNWDVMLNGSPAVDIYGGVKLAAGGELGIGVGEEEWGSGEREVLEDFARRTEGLVDLVVSRFGEPPLTHDTEPKPKTAGKSEVAESVEPPLWEGCGNLPTSADGVVFSGVGAISCRALRDISSWIEWLYTYGEGAYGVTDNPHTAYRRKRRRGRSGLANGKAINLQGKTADTAAVPKSQSFSPSRIPPSIMAKANRSLDVATEAATTSKQGASVDRSYNGNDKQSETSSYGTETLVKYLTLGYGSVWGPSSRSSSRSSSQKPPINRKESHRDQRDGISNSPEDDGNQSNATVNELEHVDPDPEQSLIKDDTIVQPRSKTIGHFLIGLKGDLENDGDTDDEEDLEIHKPMDHEPRNMNNRTLLRTLNVELPESKEALHDSRRENKGSDSIRPSLFKYDSTDSVNRSEVRSDGCTSSNRYRKLRVVVYMHQPFIFTFLFELQTPSLVLSSFYRSIHHRLGPLQRPLLSSTSPTKVFERLAGASAPHVTSTTNNPQPIYDLVYDPSNLTVHTSIPNIPEPGIASFEAQSTSSQPWTRIEALNVHTQILNTHSSTRRRPFELERTCKTSRAWWVVWMRLPCSKPSDLENDESGPNEYREAFLVRKASDYVVPGWRKGSGRHGKDAAGTAGASGSLAPGKLAEGIGVDTRKYIEGLLSLNR